MKHEGCNRGIPPGEAGKMGRGTRLEQDDHVSHLSLSHMGGGINFIVYRRPPSQNPAWEVQMAQDPNSQLLGQHT